MPKYDFAFFYSVLTGSMFIWLISGAGAQILM